MGTTTLNNNGVRKTLASQLDRLDSILDGLADNLNDAVATATASSMKEVVTVAVQEAVHAAIVEILSNAEVQKRLAANQTVNAPSPTSTLVRVIATARSCWSWMASTAKGAWSKIVAITKIAGDTIKAKAQSLAANAHAKVKQARDPIVRRARRTWMWMTVLAAVAKQFRVQFVVAVGVGVLVGAACYLGGREIASVGCGLAGFAGSLATGAMSRLRRMLPYLMGSES